MSERIDPVVTSLNAPFWDGATRGVLMLPRCLATGRCFWPPSPVSPFVVGSVDWVAADPGGVLIALVVYRRGFQKPLDGKLPYGVALVELDAGPRLQVHVVDPATVAAGDRVRIGFAPLLPGSPAVPTLI